MKTFIVCVGGSYGAEDYHVVTATDSASAEEKAKTKYKSEKPYTGNFLSNSEVVFDDNGVSQLLTNMW